MITAFDYIVVGAGSAGCVLAARLTEERGVSVAVLEAGDRDTATEILTPVTFAQLFKTSYDWDYASEPEPALNGRRVYLPRGKGLGGSSSINAMMYLRGNRLDYDDWAKDGARGWSYDEMLPYFIKAECNERGAGPYHGSLGPLSVQEGRSNHPLTDRFLEAAKQAGHPWNDDFNGARQDGIGRFQVTQRNGLRCSAAMAYLHPAADRPNLQIFTAAQTNRILFEGRRAVGVEIVRHGQAETLRAKREVILAAGAYNSPQLLMLSGIGIAAELKALGIQAWHELPVGEELQDHPGVPLCYLTDQPSLLSAGTEADIALFQNEGRGPLSSNICEGGGFYRTDPNFPAPDVELMSGPVMFYDEGLGPVTDHAYGLGPCILKPTSRGKVSLRSARPDAKPRVINNLLSTPEDRASLIGGIRASLEIAAQPQLREIRRAPFLVPASDSDADLWAFAQRHIQLFYHPTSTCGIGRVVDADLRVFGLDGLRVADASVMPTITRGNTNAPVIAIAEKAADLVRAAAA